MVRKEDLKHGAYYDGRCRNASIARWDGNRNCFIHWRTKFCDKFLEEIPHYDDALPNEDFFLATNENVNWTALIPLGSYPQHA